MIPSDPDARLTRYQIAAALTEAGFPVSPATLSSKACRGGGPPYQRFHGRAMYQWGTALQWAKGLLVDPEPRQHASESRPAAAASAADRQHANA